LACARRIALGAEFFYDTSSKSAKEFQGFGIAPHTLSDIHHRIPELSKSWEEVGGKGKESERLADLAALTNTSLTLDMLWNPTAQDALPLG